MRPQASCRRAEFGADLVFPLVLWSCLDHFPCSCFAPLANDTTKSDMARGGVDRLRVACGRPIAAAVVRGTNVRATFEHLARNLDFRLAGVVACGLGPAARIFRD